MPLADAIRASSERLGIDPVDLATAMSYETGGRFSPSMWGGKNNDYLGLIQFGKAEREKYGVHDKQTPDEQVLAAENFLRDRGVKPGMGLLDVYSTINAGAPGLYNRSDAANGGMPGTVRDKVEGQMADHRVNAMKLLGQTPSNAIGGQAGALTPMFSGLPAGTPAGVTGAAGTGMTGTTAPADNSLMQSLQGVQKMLQQPDLPMPDLSTAPQIARARQIAAAIQARQLMEPQT